LLDLKKNQNNIIDGYVKTTPQNVKEANEGLFRAKMTLPAAAAHCGMTQREMKHIFYEYLKYNAPDYKIPENPFKISWGEK
jgi:hypothetical protein